MEGSDTMADNTRQNREHKLLQQSKRGLLHIVFSRTAITILLLLFNFFLVFSFLFELFVGITLIYGGLAAATAIMMIIILNSDDDPSFKLSWCVVIAVLPLFGIVLYTWVHLDLGSRLSKRMLERSIAGALPYLPDSSEV